jgi:hypothetical protein
VSGWRVTARHGSNVEKASFDSLDEAIAEARSRAAAVLAEGGLGTVSAFRDYGPEKRVHARIEVSQKRLLGGAEAGIDVMGDGSLVPYRGAVRKRPLEAGTLDDAIERLREALG